MSYELPEGVSNELPEGVSNELPEGVSYELPERINKVNNINPSYKTYKCEVTGYFIEYGIYSDNADMGLVNCDYKYPKAFAQLLRKSIDNLIEMKIKYITQSILKEDWDLYLKNITTWEILNSTDDILVIKCKVEDFLNNMVAGIGLFNKE
jgi:hypothetical protein